MNSQKRRRDCFLCLIATALVGSGNSFAAVIRIEFDLPSGHQAPAGGEQGIGSVATANFGSSSHFVSRGFDYGSMIQNQSRNTIGGFEIRLTSAADTFDPTSTGGRAFPQIQFSPDRKSITLSGGSIRQYQWVWSQIPLSADFTGGVGTYTGKAIAASELVVLRTPAGEQDRSPEAEKRAAAWASLRSNLPADVTHIDVYGESPEVRYVCFMASDRPFVFDAAAKQVQPRTIGVAIRRGINRISYEELNGNGVFVLWWNGQREATINPSDVPAKE